MVVLGRRPEVIKLAPVILQLRSESAYFDPVIVSTSQHRQMLDQALEIFQNYSRL